MASGGASLTVPPTSVAAFASQVDDWGEEVLGDLETALYLEAESIIADAVPLTPWDQGTLKGSHFVNDPEGSEGDVSVTFGFGGAAEAYAYVQHEGVSFQHPRGGQAKYLETAIQLHLPDLAERLASHMPSGGG